MRPRSAFFAALLLAAPAHAETNVVRVAQQFGIGYLPLTVMRHEQLLEKEAARAGLPDEKVEWTQFGAGNAMNEALLSGRLDFPSGGVTVLLTIWSKTKGRQDIHGVAALDSMPLYLVSSNPKVASAKDLSEADRIGLPAVKVSIQAVTLEMAAARLFGQAQFGKFDALTVSLAHPDAMAALMSGRSEINAHFGSPPFQYQELADPRMHRIVNSYDVTGGPHTFNVIWTSRKFHDENPKLYGAFLAALGEAMKLITSDPHRAAEIYVAEENSKLAADFIEKMVRDPENRFTALPENVERYGDFLAAIGAIESKPARVQDLFFPELFSAQGR